jgi:hypothetical protein
MDASVRGATSGKRDPFKLGVTEQQLLVFGHTGCYGTCPIYLVEVSKDGAVTFNGRAFVLKLGRASATLNKDSLLLLKELLDRMDTISGVLDRECIDGHTDDFEVLLSFHGRKAVRKLRDYQGCTKMKGDDSDLKELRLLEQKIETLLQLEKWIGTPSERNARAREAREKGTSW